MILFKFRDKGQTKEKVGDLIMLNDMLPTGCHGAIDEGVRARRLAADEVEFEAKVHRRNMTNQTLKGLKIAILIEERFEQVENGRAS